MSTKGYVTHRMPWSEPYVPSSAHRSRLQELHTEYEHAARQIDDALAMGAYLYKTHCPPGWTADEYYEVRDCWIQVTVRFEDEDD